MINVTTKELNLVNGGNNCVCQTERLVYKLVYKTASIAMSSATNAREVEVHNEIDGPGCVVRCCMGSTSGKDRASYTWTWFGSPSSPSSSISGDC